MSDAVDFAPSLDPDGRAWIAQIDGLIGDVCRRWNLEPTGDERRSGFSAIVLPVKRRDQEFVLKLAWPAARTIDEARALGAWNGDGAVRLFDADTDRGALLLERLGSRRSLASVDLFEAAVVAAQLLRRLTIPAPAGFCDLRAVAAEIVDALEDGALRHPDAIPRRWLEVAQALASDFARAAGTTQLIHADLHYGNVLAGTRQLWLAIDPQPVSGEPEHVVPELLWTRADELSDDRSIRRLLAVLTDNGRLDPERARAWAAVRCVDYWLWGLDQGLTEDPKRCERILAALL